MLPRAERRAIKHLPIATARWQVGVVAMPLQVQGVDLVGMLLVAEEGSRKVRAAGPLSADGPLWPTLRGALHEPPPPCVRARPRALVCADPALADRLRRELAQTELQVQLVDELQDFDEIVGDLLGHLAPAISPGLVVGPHPSLTVELRRWARTLTALCRVAPWELLDDGFAFRFGGEVPELTDAVAVVLGLAGQQEGVVLYPTVDAFRRFQASALAHDGRALAEGKATCLYLDDADAFHPSERAALRDAGLALPGGRLPHLGRLDHGEFRPVSERDQRVLLAATEALVELCASQLDDLLVAPCTAVAATCLGRVTIRTSSGLQNAVPELTLAAEYPHSVIVTTVRMQREERPGEDVPSVVVKLGKRDAERLAREVVDADALQIEDGPIGLRLRLWADGVDLGVLCEMPAEPALASRLRAAPTIAIAVSAGGAKRHQLRPEDFAWSARLAVRSTAEAPKRARHDPVFDGPTSDWPKASETLMLYAQGVFGPVMSAHEPEEIVRVLNLASAVWSAVVMADYVGDDNLINAVRQSGAPSEMIDAMVREKRQQWPGDPRIIGDVKLTWDGKEPRFLASYTIPRGYELAHVRG
jgi:hypothetical protein